MRSGTPAAQNRAADRAFPKPPYKPRTSRPAGK